MQRASAANTRPSTLDSGKLLTANRGIIQLSRPGLGGPSSVSQRRPGMGYSLRVRSVLDHWLIWNAWGFVYVQMFSDGLSCEPSLSAALGKNLDTFNQCRLDFLRVGLHFNFGILLGLHFLSVWQTGRGGQPGDNLLQDA